MIKAELRWIFRGKTFLTLLFLTITLNALSAYGTIVGIPKDMPISDEFMNQTTISVVALGFGGSLFSMIFGALIATNDFRNSAIIRRAFLAGGAQKLLNIRLFVMVLPAIIFALASATSVIATALIVLPSQGYKFMLSKDLFIVMCGVLFAVFAMTYFGHLIGWLFRNTVGVLIGLITYMFIVETSIISFFPQVGKYLPAGAIQSITLDKSATEVILPVIAGYAVLVSWVAILLITNIFRLRKADLV